MEELAKKLNQLVALIKAVKVVAGPSIPQIPAIKQPAPPSLNPPKTITAKIPGISPDSKKDPKKVAQQIKDGSMSTKTQKIMLKFDENGQWKLE